MKVDAGSSLSNLDYYEYVPSSKLVLLFFKFDMNVFWSWVYLKLAGAPSLARKKNILIWNNIAKLKLWEIYGHYK